MYADPSCLEGGIFPENAGEAITPPPKMRATYSKRKPSFDVLVPQPTPVSALTTQVGGDHYKDFPIQPVEFITKNKIPFIEGCVIKYVARHRSKNKAQDIKKAIHFLQMLLDMEYPESK